MAYFDFSLNNGLPLIMTAGGTNASGHVFVAGRDDVVYEINGQYSMSISGNGIVNVSLTDMHALIFPNKANYSAWLYYATSWANSHGNCTNIRLDVALTRQGHGGWYDGNNSWQYAAGWKGGTGSSWVKYRYNVVEANCSGYSGDGIYHGSARTPSNMVFSLGQVNFSDYSGFWIGANLDCWEGGYEVWQYVPFPIIVFEEPMITHNTGHVDVCNKTMSVDFSMTSANQLAASGGTWELQYSTKSDFSNVIDLKKTSNTGSVTFEDVELAADSYYYIRGRIKVSDIRYSNWATTTINTQGHIPPADAIANDISETECYMLKHGTLVEGGLNGL